jgi:hypothetical protein
MKGIEFVNEKGLNWLEQETKSIYGTTSKIGSCFPVRLDPKPKFTVQQGVERLLFSSFCFYFTHGQHSIPCQLPKLPGKAR